MTYVIDTSGFERNTRLAAPHNLRAVRPQRTCETCALLLTDAEHTYCTRPNGPRFETGEQEERWVVCDGWQVIR
jgi:hypothetical protein